MIESNFWNT
jgi:hypothetical protein